jgi:acetylornithine/succinyldiaminopimelate/putrescine aminotransferase
LNSGKKTKIISFQNGFHGRSFGSLSATSNEKYRTPFEPLVPDFEILPFNDIEAAEMKIDDSVAAVIVEPLQGEGGVRLANKGFLEKLRELTSRVDAILIFDEIQCGLGRLGDMFAFQKFDVMPDIVTLAKPLAGGLPMGAVLVNREVKASVQAGDHGSTFGANAVCAAASLCVFSKIESLRLTSNVVTLAPLFEKFLRDLVEEFPEFLVEERGAGFLRGIETRIPAKEIVTRAQSSGLLILSAGTHTLRFAPPLIASKEDFQSFQNIMHETLLQLQKEQRFL